MIKQISKYYKYHSKPSKTLMVFIFETQNATHQTRNKRL
jgi:hypothetical protein